MKIRRLGRWIALALVASWLAFISCSGDARAAAAKRTKPADAVPTYSGAWRSSDGTIVIQKADGAFILEREGPAGPKEVGARVNGVVRFGSEDALYTTSTDRLLFRGKEFHRIEPVSQTVSDLKGIAAAMPVYIERNPYKSLPVTELDFFVGLKDVWPTMSSQDGWGTRYRYLYKMGQPRWAVVSAGPDGEFDPILTPDMIAKGVIGSRGDDIVMVNGRITAGAPADMR